ncbi:PAAR domain-containing protein [Caballeronia novacaledonica]|uniref:PAAR domain-containing protein n=1 Tax=Caballeronia novacaledonica TaxID=1544861 RepID=UPI001EE2EE79|nr:PAAR domain-containing protein [Caballeronia novacaledonica]GJH08040.1 PAAR domain-containing protein [Caballeronia novacaledonica]
MRRYFIVVGDSTTRGGIVLEGEERATNHDKPLSHHGARVYCHTCKAEGHIVGDGPSRPMLLHGKQVALENDLCICKCSPPPRLLRSQTNASMSFEGHELARMGYGPDGRRLPAEQSHTRYIAFSLKGVGTLEGLSCIAYFDDGSAETGTFDFRNRVRIENPSGKVCHKVALTSNARASTNTFCSAILTTLSA